MLIGRAASLFGRLPDLKDSTGARLGDVDGSIRLHVDQHVLHRRALLPQLEQPRPQSRHPVLGVDPKCDIHPRGIRGGDVDFKPGHATSRSEYRIVFGFASAMRCRPSYCSKIGQPAFSAGPGVFGQRSCASGTPSLSLSRSGQPSSSWKPS